MSRSLFNFLSLVAILILLTGSHPAHFYPINPGGILQAVEELPHLRGVSPPFQAGVNGIGATLTQIQAIPATNTLSYYITDIVIQSSTATAGQFRIQSGTATNCGTNTTNLWPGSTTTLTYPANTSPPLLVVLSTPIKVAPGHAICVLGTATNTANGAVHGYVAP